MDSIFTDLIFVLEGDRENCENIPTKHTDYILYHVYVIRLAICVVYII